MVGSSMVHHRDLVCLKQEMDTSIQANGIGASDRDQAERSSRTEQLMRAFTDETKEMALEFCGMLRGELSMRDMD